MSLRKADTDSHESCTARLSYCLRDVRRTEPVTRKVLGKGENNTFLMLTLSDAQRGRRLQVEPRRDIQAMAVPKPGPSVRLDSTHVRGWTQKTSWEPLPWPTGHSRPGYRGRPNTAFRQGPVKGAFITGNRYLVPSLTH